MLGGRVAPQPEVQVLPEWTVTEIRTELTPFLPGEEHAQHVANETLGERQGFARCRKRLERAVGLVVRHHDPSYEAPSVGCRRGLDRDVHRCFGLVHELPLF